MSRTDKQRVFEGANLDEALHKAAEALGIDEPDLDYEILEQGRRGLWGIGAKSVRIRVMPPIEPVDIVHNELTTDAITGGKNKSSKPRRERRREPQPESRPPRRKRSRGGRGRGGDRGRSGERRGGGGGGGGGENRRNERRPPREPQPREVRSEPTPPEVAAKVEQTLRQILDLMGLEITTELRESETGVMLDVKGPDEEMLTKKNGEVIGAIEFLLNRMARRAWPEAGRIHLGSDGHRTRRDDDLVALVKEVAQQVQRTGRPKRLHPMNSYERRLTHLTVREFDDLGSRSEGDGALKRVRIYKPRGGGKRDHNAADDRSQPRDEPRDEPIVPTKGEPEPSPAAPETSEELPITIDESPNRPD